MDRHGDGVRVILENSENLSVKRPVYEMFGDELRLTIYATDPATGASEASEASTGRLTRVRDMAA